MLTGEMFQHFELRLDPRAHPEHAGEIESLSWLRNASDSPKK